MGAHVDYRSLIYYLVELKDELSRVTNPKYQRVISELNNCQILMDSDNDNLPTNKDLAKKLNYSQSKMNTLLRDLTYALIEKLSNPPLVIKNIIHQIYISLPYDEQEKLSKDKRDRIMNESTWIDMVLPSTPRIGEKITIPFINQNDKNYRGYVHNVTHTITGTTQEVLVEVHPYHDYYHKWIKMKNDYEDWERWISSLKAKRI